MAQEKINDDTLLQLIRDGNSLAGAARRLGVGRAHDRDDRAWNMSENNIWYVGLKGYQRATILLILSKNDLVVAAAEHFR